MAAGLVIWHSEFFRHSDFDISHSMNLSYRLGWIFFRTIYAIYFRWRVFNAGARAADRRGHSGLQPREFH